jgi:hypothetical protein
MITAFALTITVLISGFVFGRQGCQQSEREVAIATDEL